MIKNCKQIQMICADYGMCGQIRINWPAEVLKNGTNLQIHNSRNFIPSLPSDGVIIQRCLDKKFNAIVKPVKYKKVADFDDMLFSLYGEKLPSYNNVKIDLEAYTDGMKDLCTFIDEITVSTEFLKQAIIDNYNFDRVRVIPNMLPRYIFHFDRKPHKEKDIVKPTILYAGGKQHYNNLTKQNGDFSPELIKCLHNIVDKANLVFLGGLPYFMEDVKDKLTVLPYTNLLQYPLTLNSIGADFIISPLKENVFNKCKSNLKYLESCAVGAVCIGSSFEFSPYSMLDDMAKISWTMTAKQLEYNIFELCKKDNYNRILDKQYNYINENWLENNIGKYLDIFTDKIVGI